MMNNLELAKMNLTGLSLTQIMALARMPRPDAPLTFTDRMIVRSDKSLAAHREPVCSVAE